MYAQILFERRRDDIRSNSLLYHIRKRYERGKSKGNRNLVAMVRETCCELQFSILSNFLDTHEGTENLFSSWTARSEDYSLSFEFLNSRNP